VISVDDLIKQHRNTELKTQQQRKGSVEDLPLASNWN